MPSVTGQSSRGLGAVVALMVGALVGSSSTGFGQARHSGQGIPIDRWLVSERLEWAAQDAAQDLDSPRDPLIGREGVLFPDRDLEVGPSYWSLLREDGVSGLTAPAVLALLGERGDGDDAHILAHVYLKAPQDRSVLLDLHGEDCQSLRAWLNGQPIQVRESPIYARLAGGWNTLLVRLREGARCPPALSAELLPGIDPDEEDDQGRGAQTGVEGIRVQASRPPGVRRNYPEGWVGLRSIHPGPGLSWQAGTEDLLGSIVYEYLGWGRLAGPVDTGRPEAAEGEGAEAEGGEAEEAGEQRGEAGRDRPSPPGRAGRRGGGFGAVSDLASGQLEDAELRARMRQQLLPPSEPTAPVPDIVAFELGVAGERLESTAHELRPGVMQAGSHPLRFKKLRDAALSGDGARIRMRWSDRERDTRRAVPAEPLLRALHAPIALTGWTDQADGTLSGTWRVPEALAGFTLRLLSPLPAGLTVNGTAVAPDQPNLCSPCGRGERFELTLARDRDAAEGVRVQIVEPGYPDAAADPAAPPAAQWLRALRGNNDDYLELAGRFSGDR